MNRPIIPFDEDLNCRGCGSDSGCKKKCDSFYELMHAMVDIQLQTLQDGNQISDNQELNALGNILSPLSDQACKVVSNACLYDVIKNYVSFVIIQLTLLLPSGSINCTSYSELMKMKAKMELFFATKKARDTISELEGIDYDLTKRPERWVENLDCSVTDEVRSAFPDATCVSS